MSTTMIEDGPVVNQDNTTQDMEEHNGLTGSKLDATCPDKHCETSSEYVTAIYPYMPQHCDEIKLRTGQKIKLLSKDCRHSGAEGWWVGQEPNTGYVGVFPSGYVSNTEKNLNTELSSLTNIDTSLYDISERNDRVEAVKNACTTVNIHEVGETITSGPSSNDDIVLRNTHVKNIPATELIQQQFIGSGAFGKVYRGLWRGQDIALKMFDLATSQVDNEALHLCRLSHQNIVKFHGICRLDNSNLPALVMEYAYGGSLNMVLSQRPLLGPLILLDWALQIASGMAYLHTDARICHRDLKSSNILIREPIDKPFSTDELQGCTLLITDFGMACRSSQLAPQQSKLGTVAYAAPEVCRQEGFSFKSDIWSYGVVLWELLTLDVPFRAVEQPRLLFIIAMYNYTLYIPTGVPDLFVQLFKDCWSPAPVNRPTFENIIARLESCKDCSFVDLEPSELAQIQEGWRQLIAAHHKEEQQSVAEALSSSFKSGSLDFTGELLTQLEMLRNYRESLDRVKADLVEKAHQLHMKEELYNRMAGTMGQHFMLLAVLAANHLKDPTHANQIAQPKPPPPRKRPFVCSLFRRWGSNGHAYSADNDCINSSTSFTSSFQGQDRKRSINSTQYIVSNRPQFEGAVNSSSDLNTSVLDETLQNSRRTSSRVGCSQGGIPLISPPTDMKHVVHVDSDWFTGQGLCESTMRLFPSATFTNSPIGVNTDRCRDISSGSYCGPQVRPFMNTKSDSNVADKPYVKSVHIGSCENTTADLRSHEQRYTNAQMSGRHFQRNFNRLPRKSNFIRKYENKNNLDYLQKSSNHSVGFSNFFTSTNSNHVNDDFECNGLYNSLAVISSIVDSSNDCLNAPLEALHLGDGISPHNLFKRHLTVSSVQHDLRRNRLPVHYNSKVIQSKLGIDIPMRNSNSPLFSERRRSASGPVASYIADGKKDDCLLIDSNESSIKGIPNDLLYIICNPFLPSLKFCYAGQRSRRSLSTTTPSATSDFRSDLDNSAENPCPSKVVRISAVESVLLSAFRLAASFCFWAVEPDINEAKANTLIPKNPAPLSSNRHLGNNLHLNTSFELQSSLSHIKCKNTSRGIGNTSLLFGQNESDFKHVFSSNAAHQNDKRKYKFSIQDTRRIRSADRRHNSKYNTSSTCPVCVNMGLNSIDPCETFLDHQVEFGDPHSPFLGMLAGSGRRPNLLAYNNNRAAIEADNSNSVFSPQYKMENYFSYQHEDLLTDNDQVVCKLHSHDQQQHTHSTRQSNCNSYNDLCPRNQKEMYEKSKVTGKINCAFQCSHLSVCVDCCQNNSQNKNIELTAYNRTPLPHISSPSQLTSCWSFEHCKTLDNNDFSSSNSFLSPRKLSAEYQSSIISDVLKSVDKSSVPESFGTCLSLTNRNSTNQYSHFSVSMNPVGMSRDAYLKATQDGFLNRTVYEPPIDAKLFCSSYSNRTSQANSLKRSKDEQSFPNSCVYPNIHESFLHNDLGSESESEFDQYGDVYQLDYSNLILHSPSVSPVNSQQPANQSASSTSQLNISDISQSRYEFLHNPNVNIHAHPDEDDRITLVPIESEGTNNINQLSQPTNNPRNEEAFVGICDSNSSSNNSSKKVLHRSQAIRERHRPPFLTLFRNRSLPSCVDNESPGLESRSFLLYSPSDSTSHDIHQQKSRGPESPCGPFVSLHSTFL